MSHECCFCLGICRVCCYSISQCCVTEPPPPTTYEVICLGITNCGKTTLISILLNESTDKIIPTVGFIIKDLKVGNAILNIKELGGGENIRPFWKRYYDHVQGVIFVIDGLSTHAELEETKKELFEALENPRLNRVPWMILCNKQDLEGASTHEKVIEELQLNAYIQRNPNFIVKSCSKTNRDELHSIFESFTETLSSFYDNRDNDARRV